jgi:pimeloyl-ACP methyl ester carboxylesterase
VNAHDQTPSGLVVERSGPTGQCPIVLVHAGIADRRMWQTQWPELTARRDAVRLDLRGFGDSTTRPTGPFAHHTDVIEALGHLGIQRCHLVGSSFGAGVATEVSLSRPDLVQSLLLCPPGGSLLATMTADFRRFLDTEEQAMAEGDLDAAVEANVASWVVGPGRTPSDVDPAVLAAVRTMQRRAFEVTAGWDDVEAVEFDPPTLERLPDLRTPTLVVAGGHDLETSQDAARRFCEAVPGARRVDWPDVAHLPSMERPDDFLALLIDWVTSADRNS